MTAGNINNIQYVDFINLPLVVLVPPPIDDATTTRTQRTPAESDIDTESRNMDLHNLEA